MFARWKKSYDKRRQRIKKQRHHFFEKGLYSQSYDFSSSPSNEYSELISFRIDWFDLLAVQGTLKSLLQHHSLEKASVLRRSALFMVQLSHPYMTTGKTIALTIRTFVSKVMSLLFNTLSRFVIAFLSRGFPDSSVGKESDAGDIGDLGLIPGSRRFPGIGNDNPLQDSGL